MLHFGMLTLDAGASPTAYIQVDSRPHEMENDELLSSTNARVGYNQSSKRVGLRDAVYL